jgi:hypothetical protein
MKTLIHEGHEILTLNLEQTGFEIVNCKTCKKFYARKTKINPFEYEEVTAEVVWGYFEEEKTSVVGMHTNLHRNIEEIRAKIKRARRVIEEDERRIEEEVRRRENSEAELNDMSLCISELTWPDGFLLEKKEEWEA